MNNKFLKIILIGLGFLVFIVFISYYFLYQDLKSKNLHIFSLSSDLAFQVNREDYLISAQRTIKSMTADIDKIKNSIVAKDGDVNFIESLESLARQNGLSSTIDSLVISNDTALASSSVTFLKIKARTVGSWYGSYRFVSELESMPFKIEVDKLDISSPSFGEESGVKKSDVASGWQVDFEISVLKYK